MLYQEVEELLQTQEGMSQILDNLAQTFADIEEYADQLSRSGLEANLIAEIMMKSNGHWDHLKVVHTAIDTYKKNKELTHFHQQKIEIEKNGGKFNASATEGEASALVSSERRIRNIVSAYMDSADKNIMTGQSLLKYLSESNKRTNLQEG